MLLIITWDTQALCLSIELNIYLKELYFILDYITVFKDIIITENSGKRI